LSRVLGARKSTTSSEKSIERGAESGVRSVAKPKMTLGRGSAHDGFVYWCDSDDSVLDAYLATEMGFSLRCAPAPITDWVRRGRRDCAGMLESICGIPDRRLFWLLSCPR